MLSVQIPTTCAYGSTGSPPAATQQRQTTESQQTRMSMKIRTWAHAQRDRRVHTQRKTIGVVIEKIGDGYQRNLFDSITRTAREEGVNVIAFIGGLLPSPVFDLVGKENVDALIVVASTIAHEVGPAGVAEFCRRFDQLPICTIGMHVDQTIGCASRGHDAFVNRFNVHPELFRREHRTDLHAEVFGKSHHGHAALNIATYDFYAEGFDRAVASIEKCTECGQCETKCPYKLPIRQEIRKGAETFEKFRRAHRTGKAR